MTHKRRPLRRLIAPALVALAMAVVLIGCTSSTPPPKLASSVDLNRFMGKWYVIANIPYFAEKGAVGSSDDYTLRPDGQIDTIFRYHNRDFTTAEKTAGSVAYVVPGTNNAKWRVSFFWPVYFSYLIIYVDDDYQVAAVGYPDRSLGWVFSRSPQMDNATYQAMLGRFAAEGYDISQFQRVPQSASDFGKPGYQ